MGYMTHLSVSNIVLCFRFRVWSKRFARKPVPCLFQGLHTKVLLKNPHEDTHRGETIPMSSVQ